MSRELTNANARVRILYVHHRPELGGAPTSLVHLLDSLDRDRFEPHVYCPDGPVAQLFSDAGATVHTGSIAAFTHIWASTYRGRRWLLLGREGTKLPRHLIEVERILRARRFGLVHLNDAPLLASAAVARRAGLPIVWHLRSALPTRGGRLRSRLIRGALRRFASASIAINADIAASYNVGAIVVPNGVRLDLFSPGDQARARRKLDLPLDRPIISYFGFIYPSKGFRDFIEAASLLCGRGVDATFLIVGGAVRGDEFFASPVGQALERVGLARDFGRDAMQLVSELRLQDVVRFLPFTIGTADLYRASDVVVSPSRGPELGRPVLEAAACGRAVIATGSPVGAGLLLPGVTGELLPSRAPALLAAELAGLLADTGRLRTLGLNARRHAEEHFDAARNARRIMDVYEQVLGHG